MISKRIVGWNVELQADTDNALKAYQRIKRYLKKMSVNLGEVIVHQDQDTVFTGYRYAGILLDDGISLGFTEKGFKDNPFAESVNSHFKDEYGDLIKEAKNLKQAKMIIRKCVNDWNKERIHSSLNGRSPDEFLSAFYKIKKN